LPANRFNAIKAGHPLGDDQRNFPTLFERYSDAVETNPWMQRIRKVCLFANPLSDAFTNSTFC